ncbi:MAG: hypothetical protein K9K37_01300 [Desulfocapsa sp.]|nr:hypothetical protein [Desulfocapsa sp.]
MKLTILLSALFLLSSCQAGKFGYLRLNKDVTANFESCVVLPDYNYFYNGPDAQPNAILAVKKSYTFKKGLWKEIALDKKQLCDWMRMIEPDLQRAKYSYDGYTVYNAEAVDVGLWYSREDHATIKEENGELVIYTPINRVQPINYRF